MLLQEQVRAISVAPQDQSAVPSKTPLTSSEISGLLNTLSSQNVPAMASVPTVAFSVPPCYIERPLLVEKVDRELISNSAHTPYVLHGLDGGGKTVLASSVVLCEAVRQCFSGGIFWIQVGQGGASHIGALLSGLASFMGAVAPPHHKEEINDGNIRSKVETPVAAALATLRTPALLVLDDVWESEVVEAFLMLKGLQLLITTRDCSVVAAPGKCCEIGGLSGEEALQLLQNASGAQAMPVKEAMQVHYFISSGH